MRKPLMSAIAALVALAVAVPALAETTASTFKAGFTTKREKAASGLKFSIKFSDPKAPAPKPLARFTLSLAKGSRFDVRGAPQCQATDAELKAKGSAACAANTVVGGGTAAAQAPTGGAKIKTTVKIFNIVGIPEPKNKASDDLLFQFQINGKDAVSFFARLKGSKMISQKLTGKLPGGLVVTDFKGSIKKKSKGKYNLLTTPRTCPKSRKWVNKGSFSFDGGKTDKPTSKSACKQ